MSALEVIEQITALPPEEQAVVMDFVQHFESRAQEKGVRYATPEEAKAAGEKVLRQYKEVFKKLAK